MNRIRDQFTVSDSVASKIIGDDTSRFITTRSQQALEEALSGFAIASAL